LSSPRSWVDSPGRKGPNHDGTDRGKGGTITNRVVGFLEAYPEMS